MHERKEFNSLSCYRAFWNGDTSAVERLVREYSDGLIRFAYCYVKNAAVAEEMMEDALITILESFNYPVFRQGSMSDDDAYPETFITFWNNDSPDHSHYDNSEYGTDWDFNVYVYSSDPSRTYSLLDEIRAELKTNGWIPTSKGFDVASDEPTHTGRGIECLYLQV
jgi:hypothetical protein